MGANEGWDVARAAVAQARVALGERLVSAYAIGSLAHGGFAAAVSDVDVALLLDRCTAADAETIAAIRVAGPLGERLSIFYGDWATFAAPAPPARFGAIDRLDLMDHGVLLHGTDRRARHGARPTRAELDAETRRFAADRLARVPEPEALLAAGPRALTKAVLFPVRFLHTLRTGATGTNADAVAAYDGPHAALARAALGWRDGTVGPEAPALLADHLDGLYAECRTIVTASPTATGPGSTTVP